MPDFVNLGSGVEGEAWTGIANCLEFIFLPLSHLLLLLASLANRDPVNERPE